mmetsp:Transcript_156/g.190  ORF Transcript_156/g.190 Transcript_156/m.190 type:complete len:116 (+) Transcript_156:152-499(+)
MTSKDDLTNRGRLVSNCLLEQSTYTIVGVLGGLAIFYKTRKMRHFAIAAGAGTFSDCFVGFYGNCRPLIAEYETAKTDYELRNAIEIKKQSPSGITDEKIVVDKSISENKGEEKK